MLAAEEYGWEMSWLIPAKGSAYQHRMSQDHPVDALEEKGRRETGIASKPSEGAFISIFVLPRLYFNPPESLPNSHLVSPLALLNLPRDAPQHT